MSTHQMNPPGAMPPECVLPVEPEADRSALEAALAIPAIDERRAAVAAVVAASPRYLDAWAALGILARDPIEAYAAARVGYHRGLDALRANGWRGSGLVRWEHPGNRGFLRCVAQLAECASMIGETDEVERCSLFLRQLEPQWSSVDRAR